MIKKIKKLMRLKGFKIMMLGLWGENPIFCMLLGICSGLAVTNKVENALAMGAGVIFVLIFTALTISALRNFIPARVRIITYMITIASFVIVVDRFLQAFYPVIRESIGPYVGLIITNCIIMGRAEAFASKNKITHSVMDGLGAGLGYSYTLIIIAIVREALGFGTILGLRVMPGGWTNWVMMAMAPGAFFVLSIYLWIARTLAGIEVKENN